MRHPVVQILHLAAMMNAIRVVRDIFNRLITAAALVALASCGAAKGENPLELGPVDTGKGTLTAARAFLQGTWALESFEVRPLGKPPIVLKTSGTLVYDESSNLKMEIRADEASSDILRAAGVDIRDGVISTDGRTAIDLQHHTLTYVVADQAPLMRGPLGAHRPRYWTVEGNVLILTTKDEAGQPLSIGRWRKTQ